MRHWHPREEMVTATRRPAAVLIEPAMRTIRAFIDGWNDRAHPFTWTKTADQVLSKANRQKTSTTGH